MKTIPKIRQAVNSLFQNFSPKTLAYGTLGFFILLGILWVWELEPKIEQELTQEQETPVEDFPQEPKVVTELKLPQEEKNEELSPPPPAATVGFKPFGKVSLAPQMNLNGKGSNIDSPEFFEASVPEDTLLLVTGKGNDTIEVWEYPFQGKELSPLKRNSLPNGIAIDQERDLLLIGDSEKRKVDVHKLPDLGRVSTLGEDRLESGETNVDVLTLPNGKKRVYVTESHGIDAFDLDSKKFEFSFSPDVESIEEVLADSFHQIIYVPEENGIESKKHRGGAITAYTPDGKPFMKNGSSVFGKGVFQGDGEGITLYACRGANGGDTGRGFIIAADQANGENNSFEFFDRETWQHLGTLVLRGVTLTDGISASSRPLPDYPQGLFAASNNDTSTAIVSWEKITEVTKLSCP